MEIMKGVKILDLGLYLKGLDTLVFADFHVGYEENLNKGGVLVPRFQFKDIIDRLEKVLVRKFKRIVVNGDLKDEFGTISEQEWRDALKLIDYLSRHCEELVLVRGNHDTILGPIAKKRNIKVVDYLELGDVLIAHGDKIVKVKETRKEQSSFVSQKSLISGKIKTIVIAHEHPAVSIREGARIEKFKCFLRGKWKGKKLIVIPSFNPIAEGSDVINEKPLSPYLHQNLDNFEVFIVSDKVYDFGQLKNLRK